MKKILTLAALASIAVACSTKVDEPVQYGTLSVSLGEPSVEVVSKAAETTLDPASEEAKNFTVSILNNAHQQMYSKTYFEFQTQTLPLGTYYVTAENMTEVAAEVGNGQMRLYGRSADITLSKTQLTQTATVNCTVANAKVSVAFDESVEGRFDGLQVVLAGGTTENRAVTVAHTTTGVITETWFNPSSLTYIISGTFKSADAGKEVSITNTIELEAKDNVKLVVKLNLENGQVLVPTITYDTTLDDPTEIEGEFNPYN